MPKRGSYPLHHNLLQQIITVPLSSNAPMIQITISLLFPIKRRALFHIKGGFCINFPLFSDMSFYWEPQSGKATISWTQFLLPTELWNALATLFCATTPESASKLDRTLRWNESCATTVLGKVIQCLRKDIGTNCLMSSLMRDTLLQSSRLLNYIHESTLILLFTSSNIELVILTTPR